MSKHGALKFVNGVLTWAPITTGKSTTLTTTPALSVDNYLSSLTPPSTPNSPALSSYLAPSIGAAAASTVSSATTTKTSEPATQPPPPWRCYYSGDLNPQLVEFNFNDLLVDPSLAQSSENPLGALGEAISRSIRPNVTRGAKASLTKAVVLGGYVVEGQEALSYNLNIVTGDAGALANRLQMLYIRVPELTFLSDPYCSDNSFSPEQVKALVEMHPVAAVPNWVSTQPNIFPGSIVEIEFIQGFNRGIVKNILEEETDLQSIIQALGASGAFSDGGAGVFLGAPIKGAEGAHDFVNKMRASPHLKDYSDAMLAALASNAQHESGFILNANGDAVSGYFKSPNVSQAKRNRVKANALGKMCSHGFWQMNVCATDGGGQRFAAHFGLDVVNDKEALVAAFQDPEKQFEMINIEMRHLFGGDVSVGTGTAEYYAGRISAEYERCHSCHKNGNQWQSRSKVAMGIYNTITTTATT